MLPRFKLLLCAAVLSFSASQAAVAADAPTYGPQLQGFDYPYPLKQFSFNSQGAPLQMGYLDVSPAGRKNGQTVVLMHGKNFCAATWGGHHQIAGQPRLPRDRAGSGGVLFIN